MRRCSHVKGVSRQKILTRALKSVARERNVDPGQEQKSEAGKEGKEGKEDKENASTKRREHAHTHKTHEAAGVDTSAGGEVAGVDTSAGGEVEALGVGLVFILPSKYVNAPRAILGWGSEEAFKSLNETPLLGVMPKMSNFAPADQGPTK